MKRYTLGFLFDATLENVLLIRKTHPEWQLGKLNGVGGKMEGNETIPEGMAREMFEEAGIETQPEEWTSIGKMGNAEWEVHILAHHYHGEKTAARSLTEEEVQWHATHNLPEHIIPNLAWIIPLCLDHLLGNEIAHADVHYKTKN